MAGVDRHATLGHHLLEIATADAVAAIPADRPEYDLAPKMAPPEARHGPTPSLEPSITERQRLCNICGRPHRPIGARRIFWNERRVGWVLPSVRPLIAASDRRGPVWEFANQVEIRAACSRHIVANWLPGSASRPLRHTLLPTAPNALGTPRSRASLYYTPATGVL